MWQLVKWWLISIWAVMGIFMFYGFVFDSDVSIGDILIYTCLTLLGLSSMAVKRIAWTIGLESTEYYLEVVGSIALYSPFETTNEDKLVPAPERYRLFVLNTDDFWTDDQLELGEMK